ncbi:cytochrome b [Pseudomonas gingeri]|uniref:Cytochrome b/b6 domain-containing protein n=1 Tax=Pseudomonas gingeri TaxID=117681 RepID=A0A7Y7YA24_9PSED|nr:cytochrome b/b6 domain-containing protein [Pseudomonas gingeri]NWA01752.1 cytochrome b/b6 domain-containing protein [Pseudomonas gingeri]NWA12851.1 cytochrome b/b6 domain-containing protein [Pseudomonas gingeri]NWA57593.1 cytochrome b/b6 domain-containing protein [Pseudomonas gingeri]NWA93222.1 cytochrome b/b6 domain-containing protein [Pseudomonas gingeri]NWB03418.1 cytochrome b/b6 domain-containing protein [Pseudomonas gingeri]
MQLRDNGLRFSPITIIVHWLVVVALLSILGLGLMVSRISDSVLQMELARVQNLMGLILFLVSIYRFWARITSYHPLPTGTPNPIELIISRSVAVALALAMVLLPIAVWASRSAAGQVVGLPGGFSIPSLIPVNEEFKHVVDVLFNIGASAFLAGLALHIFGAVKNHIQLKNNTLKRMLGKKVEL